MHSSISWEIVLIVISGLLTIWLAIKANLDSKQYEKKLAKSQEKTDAFQEKLMQKQEEYIKLQNDLQVKSDAIIELQNQLGKSANKIIANQQVSLFSITGGNSFPIISYREGTENILHLYISNGGKYKLTDINILVLDVNKLNELINKNSTSFDGSEAMTNYKVGFVNPNSMENFGLFKIANINAAMIHISTSVNITGLVYYQNIFLRRKNGKLLEATQVRSTVDKKLLYNHLDKDFLNPGETISTFFK